MSKTTNKFSPEVRERTVRLVLDNQSQNGSRWQAVKLVLSRFGAAPLIAYHATKETNDGHRRVGRLMHENGICF